MGNAVRPNDPETHTLKTERMNRINYTKKAFLLSNDLNCESVIMTFCILPISIVSLNATTTLVKLFLGKACVFYDNENKPDYKTRIEVQHYTCNDNKMRCSLGRSWSFQLTQHLVVLLQSYISTLDS